MNTTASQKSPQELLKEVSGSRQKFSIGIPKESRAEEKRLALTPEAVDMIAETGHRVLLESGAGAGINYPDGVYAESGAEISTREETFAADIVLKIAPPLPAEIALMKKRATLCHSLQLSAMSSTQFGLMAEKNINAIAYELITPDGLDFPVRNIFSELEGAAAIAIASELLSNEHGGKGIIVGGVPGVAPTEVVIIGAGVAGTVAAKTAMAMGATVKVFDSDLSKLRRLQSELGTQVFASVFHPNVLYNAFRSADVVIGAMRFIDDSVRFLISEEVIGKMKKGALLIDLRVTLGGCFETTCMLPEGHPEVFEKRGILHYCKPNISSRVARTTSMSLSNVFTPYFTRLSDSITWSDNITSNPSLRSGHYMYAGKLVNRYVAKYFNLPSHDIGIFLAGY